MHAVLIKVFSPLDAVLSDVFFLFSFVRSDSFTANTYVSDFC
jgi:hypothetical protein